MHIVFGGHFGMSYCTKQLAPSAELAIVIGLSSDTPSGQAYLNGGGGLHVAFGGHCTLTAAMQPSLPLKTVHCDCCCGCCCCGTGRGGFVTTGGGGSVATGAGAGCGCGAGSCGGGAVDV